VEYISIHLNVPGNAMQIVRESEESDIAFKLSTVLRGKNARRIETNNGLLAILDAGFPRRMVGMRLPVSKALDGSLFVDLRPQIPLAKPE
jgi:hypothetical protein